MDAGKIRSFVPGVDLRTDTSADAKSGRRSDAGIVVPKVAPLVALDSLLTSADADLRSETPPVPRPPNGVVVDLTLRVVTAEAARQLARSLANPPDYSHLDPHKPHPERSAAEAAAALADEIDASSARAAAPSLERTIHEPASPAATSPGIRPDLHPHGVAHAAPPSQRTMVHAQQAGVSAADQAREAERLAGLALAAERFAGTPAQLGKLALAAAMLGALIVVVLM